MDPRQLMERIHTHMPPTLLMKCATTHVLFDVGPWCYSRRKMPDRTDLKAFADVLHALVSMSPDGLVKKSALQLGISMLDKHLDYALSGMKSDEARRDLWCLAEAHKLHQMLGAVLNLWRVGHRPRDATIATLLRAFEKTSVLDDVVGKEDPRVLELPGEEQPDEEEQYATAEESYVEAGGDEEWRAWEAPDEEQPDEEEPEEEQPDEEEPIEEEQSSLAWQHGDFDVPPGVRQALTVAVQTPPAKPKRIQVGQGSAVKDKKAACRHKRKRGEPGGAKPMTREEADRQLPTEVTAAVCGAKPSTASWTYWSDSGARIVVNLAKRNFYIYWPKVALPSVSWPKHGGPTNAWLVAKERAGL